VHWQHRAAPQVLFETLPGTRAAAAIDGITGQRFRGECLGALQITDLQAARKAIGPDCFNLLHTDGLAIGDRSGRSSHPHVVPASKLTVAAMVPGDWVYMQNKDDYNTDLRPDAPRGYWTGENALYMGRYDLISTSRVYYDGAPSRSSGMGVYSATEYGPAGIHTRVKQGYIDLLCSGRCTQHRHPTPLDSEIRWTSVVRLVTGD
jgi:hypothetical protein